MFLYFQLSAVLYVIYLRRSMTQIYNHSNCNYDQSDIYCTTGQDIAYWNVGSLKQPIIILKDRLFHEQESAIEKITYQSLLTCRLFVYLGNHRHSHDSLFSGSKVRAKVYFQTYLRHLCIDILGLKNYNVVKI